MPHSAHLERRVCGRRSQRVGRGRIGASWANAERLLLVAGVGQATRTRRQTRARLRAPASQPPFPRAKFRPTNASPRSALQDFELAAWQMTYLCLAPRRVCVPVPAPPASDTELTLSLSRAGTGMSTTTSVRGLLPVERREERLMRSLGCVETKNTWARDDPAMLLLISLCLVGTAPSGLPVPTTAFPAAQRLEEQR